MGSYSVIITKAAAKEIEQIDRRSDREKILDRIRQLSADPRPHGSKKLKGWHERYRLRQGDFRILYEIRDAILIVTVVHVGHRKEVYRGNA
ncbi:MAG: type II toxin-antitoxin system RelE/ParE family toxin [Acidobacteriota bacterium]|nr:type II toxin-antitoxin system RelE/ParE family toxin [Acidobacteriota bacterium]